MSYYIDDCAEVSAIYDGFYADADYYDDFCNYMSNISDVSVSDVSDVFDDSVDLEKIGCEVDGERVVGWYGELTTIPIQDELAQILKLHALEDLQEQTYYQQQLGYHLDNPKFGKIKFSNVKSVDSDLRKYDKQGVNGAKGRRTCEYSAKRIAKERRAYTRVSHTRPVRSELIEV
jgi:hypothetical protein